MSITRRIFMRDGAMAVVGTAVLPAFLKRAAFATESLKRNKRLVVVFQRGAADGLNIVIPHGERNYFSMRPTIGIPEREIVKLDGLFGLHPQMSSLKPLWDAGHLAVVHASGSPDNTRSHFDAQDYMESGTPGVKSTEDGWLNRAVAGMPADEAKSDPFRAVALGTTLPRALAGKAPAVAVSNVNDFGVAPRAPQAKPIAATFESMYENSVDSVLHGTGQETFEAVKMLKAADPSKYRPAAGANYPRGRFGDSMKQTAQLIKADLGVQVAFVDLGGWDHHVNEGSTQGQLANLLREFSQSLSAFWTDLGPLGEDTLVVTMSEFGRTARENGTRGTDHGHANVMFLLGGPVRGGRAYGKWPGLEAHQLYEGRDLALTTDFRRVLSEAVYGHLGNRNLHAVFPAFESGTSQFLRYLG